MTLSKLTIRGCARCGEVHEALEFRKLGRPIGRYTYFALCPQTGEPVLLEATSTESTLHLARSSFRLGV